MAKRAHIQYRGSPDVLAKDFKAIVKQVLKDTVSDWHSDTLPKHFTEAGRRKYQYRARTRPYRKKKRKYKGHGDPLVWTGELKKAAIRRARISGTSKSARASMSVPWYAKVSLKGRDAYADEMTAVTQGEAAEFARDVQRRITAALNKAKNAAPAVVR